MKKYLFTILILLGFYQANSQCTSCNYYIGGANPGGGAVLYTSGDLSPSNSKVCVTGDVTTTGFGNNANGWSVCVNNGVTWNAGNFNFMNNGTVNINNGTMNASGFSGNGANAINVGTTGVFNFSGTSIQGVSIVNDGQFNLTANATVTATNSSSITNNGSMVHSGGGSSKLVINNATLTNNSRWIQVINATPAELFNFSAKTSLGVLNPNLFLGRLFKI
jgi:hypothetical protein